MTGINYKKAGVDITAGDEVVKQIKSSVEKTHSSAVLSPLGGFAGLYSLKDLLLNYHQPVLVQSIDGVGTKSIIARMAKDYSSLGQCLVSATVNDIIVCGAKPLTLLDYIASDKLDSTSVVALVQSIADSCQISGISLVGGETAEMPDVYLSGETDVVGVVTGIVEKSKLIDGTKIKPGNQLIGITSSGLHTNGYSLARHICFEHQNLAIDTYIDELSMTIGEALLKPHINYCNTVHALFEKDITINGMAHITGGGIPGNLSRVLPSDSSATVNTSAWPKLAIFEYLATAGKVGMTEMFRAFNMGIGFVIITSQQETDRCLSALNYAAPNSAFVIGEIVSGNQEVLLK